MQQTPMRVPTYSVLPVDPNLQVLSDDLYIDVDRHVVRAITSPPVPQAMRSWHLHNRTRTVLTRCRMSSVPRTNATSWFDRLFGFEESSYEETRAQFEVQGKFITVTSQYQDAPWSIGEFVTPSLASLRDRSDHLRHRARKLRLSVAIGDVTELLSQPENRWATFQVASQLNCLEFPMPSVTPEAGISGYDTDRTQGPACSVACGPATVYRHYFVPVSSTSGDVSLGQRAETQLNNADELLAACHPASAEVTVRNGYMRAASAAGLQALNAFLADQDRHSLMQKLKIGVHSDVQVTSKNWGKDLINDSEQLVTQVFCSACPVAYSDVPAPLWEPIARIILEAAYEATLRAAALSAAQRGGTGGSKRVYLTLLGGGVFGNPTEWIMDAIADAAERCAGLDLDVKIVQHAGRPDAQLQQLIRQFES